MLIYLFVDHQESWEFLLECDYTKSVSMTTCGLSLPDSSDRRSSSEEEKSEKQYLSWDTTALLYQCLPAVVFALHLVHEVRYVRLFFLFQK